MSDDLRLLALDIDGTLLRSDRSLAPRVVEAVRAASARVPVILASARPPRALRAIHEALALATPQVAYNGALAWDRASSTATFHAPLSATLTGELIAAARAIVPHATVNVEHVDRWYTDRVDQRFVTETGRLFPPDFVGPLASFAQLGATKLMLHAAPDEITLIRSHIEPVFAGRAACIRTDADLLQVVNAGVSKWRTLVGVATGFGIGPAQIMAIGDNENDVEMIRNAGLGVAMANGTADALAAARWVAPANDEDGVAVAIERHLL